MEINYSLIIKLLDMKKFVNVFLLAFILPAFIMTACKDDGGTEPAAKGNFETLKSYMIAEGYDLPELLASWVVTPKMVADGGIVADDYSIPGYYVFDIRSSADFASGHIKGSINVVLTDILIKANEVGTDKPILVVCFSGQTASRGVMALRLSGYPDAQVMKFGLSYWNPHFDLWTAKVADIAVGNPNWTFDAAPNMPVNDFPTWETTSTDGAEILANNVTTMLAASGWIKSSADILAAPSDYKIYNFWAAADYLALGHYVGAYQIQPISLAGDVVKGFPTADEFQVYCYTGQTSAFTTAWLQVLGYNATSIGNGVNSLSWTALDESGKPAWHHSFDYEYVTAK